jgi:porphyrinogen peroxidase
MIHPQTIIVDNTSAHSKFLLLKLNTIPRNQIEFVQVIKKYFIILDAIKYQFKDFSLNASISFSYYFWKDILKQKAPDQLKPFTDIIGKKRFLGSNNHIFLHINGERPDLIFHFANEYMLLMEPYMSSCQEIDGFDFLDNRDLTEFIDGTENPEASERKEVALIDNGDFEASSFVLVQKYIHKLTSWKELSDREQEKIIGRTKIDSTELKDNAEDAHIVKAQVFENNKEKKIVRHSKPYGKAYSDKGLFFVAYCKELKVFDTMLRQMAGTSGSKSDRILDFSDAASSDYFFTPSIEIIKKL